MAITFYLCGSAKYKKDVIRVVNMSCCLNWKSNYEVCYEGYGVSTASSISLPASVAAESTDEDDNDDDDDDESTVTRYLRSDSTAAAHHTVNSLHKLQSPSDYRYRVAVSRIHWSVKTCRPIFDHPRSGVSVMSVLSLCYFVCLYMYVYVCQTIRFESVDLSLIHI